MNSKLLLCAISFQMHDKLLPGVFTAMIRMENLDIRAHLAAQLLKLQPGYRFLKQVINPMAQNSGTVSHCVTIVAILW